MNAETPKKNTVGQKVDSLPPWQLILHNDDFNVAEFVAEKLQTILRFDEAKAVITTLEAHNDGQAFLLITHKEKAEFYVDSFMQCQIVVTMEKA